MGRIIVEALSVVTRWFCFDSRFLIYGRNGEFEFFIDVHCLILDKSNNIGIFIDYIGTNIEDSVTTLGILYDVVRNM